MELRNYPLQTKSPNNDLHYWGCAEHVAAVMVAHRLDLPLLPEDIVEIHKQAITDKIILNNALPMGAGGIRCYFDDNSKWEAYADLVGAYLGRKITCTRLAKVAPRDLAAALRAHASTCWITLNNATKVDAHGAITGQHFTGGPPDFERGLVLELYNPWPGLTTLYVADYRLWEIREG